MKIEKIKKMNNGQYKIEFDDKTDMVTYDEVILNNNLLFQKELDKTTLQNITHQNSYYQAYNKAVNYISKRIRSKKEVREYLLKWEVKDCEKIIKELEEKGFLNDKNFAYAFASDKLNLSNDGPYKIRKELEKYDIDDIVIEEVLLSFDREQIVEKLKKLIRKKVSLDHKHSKYYKKQKIVNDLINLGYSKEMILQYYEDDEEENDALEKDFEKLYQKLSRKEEGDIYPKIRQKLYQKGYRLSDIEKWIQKKEG